jgi:hypothetical protein
VPLFRSGKPLALLGLSAAESVSSGFHIPTWDLIDEDPTGQVGAGVVTIERDGYYLLCAGVGRQGVATASAIFVRLMVNGSTVANGQSASVTTAVGVTCARYLQLDAGELVKMEASVHSSATASYNAGNTFFSCVRLGPVRWT